MKYILPILSIALAVTAVQAQWEKPNNAPQPHSRAALNQTQRLNAIVNLTPDQLAKISAAEAQTQKTAETIIASGQTKVEKREKLQVLFGSTRALIGNLLTPEQRAKLQASQQQNLQHGPQSNQNPHPRQQGQLGRNPTQHAPQPGQQRQQSQISELNAIVNLTPDQLTKISSAEKQLHEIAQGVRRSETITKEEKQTQLKELHNQMRTTIDRLLTHSKSKITSRSS